MQKPTLKSTYKKNVLYSSPYKCNKCWKKQLHKNVSIAYGWLSKTKFTFGQKYHMKM